MLHFEWMGPLVGLALLVCEKNSEWHARRLAMRRGCTLTAKFALSTRRWDTTS